MDDVRLRYHKKTRVGSGISREKETSESVET